MIMEFQYSNAMRIMEEIAESQHPPLRPKRQPVLLITKHEMEIRCCGCRGQLGHLTCPGCFAVRYCSAECRKAHWRQHKVVCREIKKRREDAMAIGEILSSGLGGEEKMLKSSLATEGYFEFIDQPSVNEESNLPKHEQYFLARHRLTYAYVKCGEHNRSPLAFRLAAENMLDLLCLSYKDVRGEYVRYFLCGWMIAGGMDQQAMNYLMYFQLRNTSDDPLPYLQVVNQDIEGDSFEDHIQEEDDTLWYHDYMLIALIKYKRMKALIVERQKMETKWRTFMMGTHPRAGIFSVVMNIRGKSPVIETLGNMLIDSSIEKRINRLSDQILKLLSLVHLYHDAIIPNIIDRNNCLRFDINDEHRFGYKSYGHAWNMGIANNSFLLKFFRTGELFDPISKAQPHPYQTMDLPTLASTTPYYQRTHIPNMSLPHLGFSKHTITKMMDPQERIEYDARDVDARHKDGSRDQLFLW